VAEYFEETYDYSQPLKLPRPRPRLQPAAERHTDDAGAAEAEGGANGGGGGFDIPVWEGVDRVVSEEIRVVGPDGEKVDVMTFRGSFERDLREFDRADGEFHEAVETQDDDAVETIMDERFYYRPEMCYSPDKLVLSYGVPAPTPAFVYSALGKRPLPTREEVITDAVDSLAARFNLRYREQQWLAATARLVADDPAALRKFLAGDMTLFTASQFNQLGGLRALAEFADRDAVFEALRPLPLVRQSTLGAQSP
jgi:hypothetical protein